MVTTQHTKFNATNIEDDKIVVHPSPRQGWRKAFREFAAAGSEEIFFPDFFKDEDLSEWTWGKQ
ncbi:MAG: hypothetical protein LBT94_03340, partial [Prevotellaceae bacterium]|nr:hypothetical protein [Prevotellaceae bacterium]